MKKMLSDYKLKEQGLNKVLGNLENEIMDVVWDFDGEVTVRDVYEQLASRRQIAYTTVMTIMVRLADKNILAKRKDGNTMFFLPEMGKEEFTENMVGSVLDSLFEDFAEATMAHFLNKVNKKDKKTIEKLQNLLDAQEVGAGDGN